MDPAAWRRLDSVFFGALAVAPEERDAYLDRACAGDARLRAEVAAILDAHRTAGGPERWTPEDDAPADDAADAGSPWLDAPALDPPDAGAPARRGALAGTRIGAYRLEALIGRGGMGEVYRAERVDEAYRQEAAVKLVHAGPRTEELARRFHVERQILANLQHPNIATLLDGGVTADGQPYLVMEYVRGVPITEYADARGLDLDDRLRLFRTVCEAVQYAHANLVVHRDLKPSNILVTDDGRVRLLDFGIAKLLEPGDAGAGAAAAAVTGDTLVFTPEHAAPEQLQRRPVTTATDVYALGVLLYELLTGTRPFRAPTPIELFQAVCHEEPPRPSAAVATASAPERAGEGDASGPAEPRRTPARSPARRLRGDLDHIVLMALRKEPERRYASAGQFAEDVARSLEGRPVLARPDSPSYRARRFLGRNRVAAALAGLAAAALVAGLLGTASQARRARSEAARAAADRDRAERISALLVDMFRISDPHTTRGETVTAREVLDAGAARIVADFADRPETQADLLTEVGRIYENLGLFDDANAHLERALELRRATFGDGHPDVAASLTRLAFLRIQQGRVGDAVELARTASASLREHGGPDSPHPTLADALLALGDALRLAGSPDDAAGAAAAYTEALSLLERRADPGDARIAQAYFGLAGAAHGQGRFRLADSLLRETIARYTRLGGRPHPNLAASLNDLGLLRTFARRPDDAEPLLRRALEMRRRIYGPVHPAVAQTLTALANALSLVGRAADAVTVAEDAVAVADSVWGPDHVGAAEARLALGRILLELDRGERAVRVIEEAGEAFRAEYGPAHPVVFGTRILLAQAIASMGRFDEARSRYAGLLDRVGSELGPEHPYRAHLLVELARLDLDAGRIGDAEAKASASLALTRAVLRPDHRFALWATRVLARVEAARGRLAEAGSLLRDVLDAQRAAGGDEHPETARTLVALADVETRLGRAADAEAHARAAITILDANRVGGPGLADARSVLGGALAARGRYDEAGPLLRGALEVLTRSRGARPSRIAAARERLRAIARAR